MKSNHRMHASRSPALPFRMPLIIGCWIRCQQPVPAAVGELCCPAASRDRRCAITSCFRLEPRLVDDPIVSGAAMVQVAISRSLYRGVRRASARILFAGAPTSLSAPLTFQFCISGDSMGGLNEVRSVQLTDQGRGNRRCGSTGSGRGITSGAG